MPSLWLGNGQWEEIALSSTEETEKTLFLCHMKILTQHILEILQIREDLDTMIQKYPCWGDTKAKTSS